MRNLRRRIAKLEKHLGAKTIALRFADGGTEVINASGDYVATLFSLLVQDPYGDTPRAANPLQAKHLK